jgi:adenylosuccinate synthase
MKSISIIGLQNGDEGKGKFVEFCIEKIKENIEINQKIIVHRWQGGPNAGHTVVIGDKNFHLHQLPSGIIRDKTYCLLGTGMFINPRKLLEEIKTLEVQGIKITSEIFGISSKAHVILDYHTSEDQKNFNLKEHTTTGNGIKQCARDKAARVGIRFIEFLDKNLMIQILKERVFPEALPNSLGTYEEFVNSYEKERNILKNYCVLENEVMNRKDIGFKFMEGAQGLLIDLDQGQYPGVTSSNPGLPHYRPEKIIGVFKLYGSSVGIGDRPYVSEINPKLQEKLIEPWHEFGTTTKKPRHIGWFDVVAGKYAMECGAVDEICGSCLDRLEELHKLREKLKIVVAYEIDGKKYDTWIADFDRRDILKKAKPVFEEFDTWDKTIDDLGNIHPNALKYIERLEQLLGNRFCLIGVGPEHDQMIVRKNIFK